MHVDPKRPIAVTMLMLVPLVPTGGAGRAAEPTTRTVYVSVTDGKGTAVTDLTAANFTVKEGGKPREIVKAEPAKARMHLALMVDERLIADGGVRTGIFEFMKRVQPAAEIALIIVGLRNVTVVDYTTDLNKLVQGINGLALNPGKVSNFNEALLDVAKTLTKQRPDRPVIVGVAFPGGGEAGSAEVKEVMNQLRQSAASLSAVTVGQSGGGGEQVLEDGAKQSGGRCLNVTATTAMQKSLQQITDDLLAQYVISYTLPDGVKLDRKLSVGVDRKGLSLRAPAEIPDR